MTTPIGTMHVISAKAGIQAAENALKNLDSRFHGNDEK
jgi:hypothetical protein